MYYRYKAWIFYMLICLGLVPELGWLTIPVGVLAIYYSEVYRRKYGEQICLFIVKWTREIWRK